MLKNVNDRLQTERFQNEKQKKEASSISTT